jgi:putative flippase GtrA
MQFILYCVCGGVGVTTDFAIYWLAVQGGLWYQSANGLGYLAGTLMSFALNRIFTFGMRDRVLQRLASFLGVAAVGFGMSALMLWILVQLMQVDALVAKLITLPLVVILQFSLNRRLTFQSKNSVPSP